MYSALVAALMLLPLVLGNVSDIDPDADVSILSPSSPVLMDARSQAVQEAKAGQQLMIGTTVANNDDVRDWAAVILVEVRDSTGVTIYLGWQSGIVSAGGEMDVGLSWIPESAGGYEFRTFAISSLDNPRILSIVSSARIDVGN